MCSTITLEKFDYSLHLCVRAHMLLLMRVAGRFCLKILGRQVEEQGRKERGTEGKRREGEREKYSGEDVTASYFWLLKQ